MKAVTGIRPHDYDRSIELDGLELKFLSSELPERVKYSRIRQPDLNVVRRLIQPLDDVLDVIDFRGAKRRALALFLLEQMGRRQKSFWGWSDAEWVEVVNSRRYDANRLIAVAYLLCGFQSLDAFAKRRQVFFRLAERVFGCERFMQMVTEVEHGLAALGYKAKTRRLAGTTVAQLLLNAKSAGLEHLTREALVQAQQKTSCVGVEKCLIAVSRFLASKHIIDTPLTRVGKPRYLDDPEALLADVPEEWARLARYWYENSTLTAAARLRHYYRLLCVGRWLRATHPKICSPADWTRSTAAEAVSMLATQSSGEWSHLPSERIRNFGKPYAARTRMLGMVTLRIFFQDLQEWEMIHARFEPYRAFRTPRSITSLIERSPRIIADDVWAKLVWAGMNLTSADLSRQGHGVGKSSHYYPLPLVRALTMVWLFAGIRWHEIRRLRFGCIRWQEGAERERVCLLSIPVNKTGTAYSKPVDKLVGEAIEVWEKERPAQPKLLDMKTGEQVDFLFLFRFRQVGYNYLNHVLIRTLCQKAGIPQQDVRGKITGHRARATIATQPVQCTRSDVIV